MKKDKEQIEQRNRQLREWACNYHSASFIESDPVQFPHRYVLKQDIEISGLLTAILSFGNRRQILKKADQLDEMMGHDPLRCRNAGRKISGKETGAAFTACCRMRNSGYILKSYIQFMHPAGPWRMCCWNMTALRCSGCVLFWESRIAVRRRS